MCGTDKGGSQGNITGCQSITQLIMQHILTLSASSHIYQLCNVIMLIKHPFLMPLNFFEPGSTEKNY